ncbi:LysM peptidoglycan-binding domain-containing protein [Rhodobacteraceae bacterium 2376]|uniref:LysM peptidoglycan-binding domain-containing protein n=1 Tax=Rhabdonatronobacter sediminivivens TaxID=2743469 RepID=A0A7Z0I1Q2_9RHOB|nr:LysM peptidoglycan-binding domain-containing protein [Rhabdonatronobacter sediminivivens]NYS26326.1 LysM peptidoglycan-binding domain-containing protein [Rhabdonatronobacter sediminivivens]
MDSKGFRRVGWVAALGAVVALGACSDFDLDLRSADNGFSTADAARQVSASRPRPDDRGVITYPNFQVAVARSGDSVADIANRVGVSPDELARFNALTPDTNLRGGEVLALPGEVPATTAPAQSREIEITTLAETAIDRAEGTERPSAAPQPSQADAPQRHRVERGESAYSIARLYNVTPRALADWNGLDPEMRVREGQVLTIPTAAQTARRNAEAQEEETRTAAAAPPPGSGSSTPTPPSAARPMPEEAPSERETAAAAEEERPSPPAMVEDRTEASAARLSMPLDGRIIRAYSPGRFDGIGIAGSAGSSVRAAASGTVAAITRDTNNVPIMVIRHEGDLLTVYANIDDLRVERNDRVSRGQVIATVRAGDPSFLHFEVRDGFNSVDPMPLLQ